MNNEQVKTWYNDFSTKQHKTGVNLRHYTIMNFLIGFGLRSNSNVLEVGCGIGTLTGLLHRYVSKGKLVATDISDESIRVAKATLPKSDQIDFVVTDMKDFKYSQKFDFLVLPDVLEHIPVEAHNNLFKVLSELMHQDSVIAIHIPHPVALDYIRTHNPDKLQIIDQSLQADHLTRDAYSHGLTLVSYNQYSLYADQPDYIIMRFMKQQSYSRMTPLKKNVIIRKKLIARVKSVLALS